MSFSALFIVETRDFFRCSVLGVGSLFPGFYSTGPTSLRCVVWWTEMGDPGYPPVLL